MARFSLNFEAKYGIHRYLQKIRVSTVTRPGLSYPGASNFYLKYLNCFDSVGYHFSDFFRALIFCIEIIALDTG